jgi:membrane AbrB-like protein
VSFSSASRQLLLTFLIAGVSGVIARWLNVPLAWMIGPLLGVGLGTVFGIQLMALKWGRELGQTTVGVAIGLQMTPPVLMFLWQEIGLILGAGFITILLGVPMALLLNKTSGVDRKSCYFAAVPGGLAEMAILGSRYGAEVEPVVIGQTIRLIFVILTVPPLFALLGLSGQDPFGVAGTTMTHPITTLILVILAAALSWQLSRLKINNAWLVGGIAIGAGLALFTRDAYNLPMMVVYLAQFFLGISLGTMFKQEFLRSAPRFIQACLLMVLLMTGIAALFAGLLTQWTVHDFGTLMLGFAPGGITEMVLTAKELEFSAPLITAIHMARILMIVFFAALLFRLTLGRHQAKTQ